MGMELSGKCRRGSRDTRGDMGMELSSIGGRRVIKGHWGDLAIELSGIGGRRGITGQ